MFPPGLLAHSEGAYGCPLGTLSKLLPSPSPAQLKAEAAFLEIEKKVKINTPLDQMGIDSIVL
ncbi:hypothetical protein Pyn_23958 [Prunus yedoensis var. nudiflora]|uniref:Uncharacterized protein n=1 Tax=Prunus yedoensis var. nudiflora TaxID=2094558 RepID=A0A314XH42_PRUYE|nr:hypothetical protein Pyn_23958 [Prunus yedoensis var. nudiflora]